MKTISRLEQANDNAAAFWLAQARAHGWQQLVTPRFTAVRCARTPDDAHRIVITRPYGATEPLEDELAALLRDWSTVRLTLEDPYGRLDMTRYGYGHGRAMAVMVREPGPVEPPLLGALPGSGARGGGRLTVDETFDADEFAEVEHAIVEGFPIEAHQPWKRGVMLPGELLWEQGFRAWLGRIDGAPAGACLTYDDGQATGVYWVATLPDHRSRGVARAVLETALAAADPERPATLVATLLGEPLYLKLGFTEHGRTHWWSVPTPPAPAAS
ncbi:GNAT family N-acetyltransferase [Kitasatospora sp. NPDC127111]|uniref:GNAT family N-acetyltransferase n=1 Tax=Kitasatospora sp. NPDC127111 TaxID=3345363 RepID=UPI003631BD56